MARDGIALIDPASRQIVDANPCLLEFLGLARSEVVGRGLAAIGLINSPAIEEAAFAALQEGRTWSHETTIQTRQGCDRDAEIVANCYREASNEVIQCNIRDTTDRKNAKQKLEQAVANRTAQLKDIIGQLETFSYTMAHDLRGPLRTMQGYAHLLWEDYGTKIDDPGRAYLLHISAAAARMHKLVTDVLVYTHVTSQVPPLLPVSLAVLVDAIMQQDPVLAAAKPQVVGTLPQVWGDELALTLVITNLLSNAVKFIPPPRRPDIRLWAETEGQWTTLSVSDNGIGVPAGDRERIFQMFERTYASKGYEGSGIGLAIVRKTVERLGGSVGVESEIGQGSRFWIRLQRCDAD